MQDPKTKQVDSWDEEVVDVKPTQVDDWGEEVVDVPLKKNGANQAQVTQNQSVGTQESTTPSEQPTTPSATSTSESEPTASVTGTPTPMGMQLQDVEIVAEKPNILEKARGAFNYGLESYVKDITDYDLLRSNAPAQRKIELLEQRRSEQLPIGEQDIIQQAAGMVGGTIKGLAKSVGAGIVAAPATPLASVVAATGVAMGDGWKQGYTSSFKEAYYQAINEGKTPEQAIEIAQNVGETGGVGGAVEGAFGAIPLTKGATTLIKPSSKLLKKGIEYVLDAAIDGSVAAGAQVATNIEAQREGLKRELASGAKESFFGEATFGLVSNAAHPVYKLISKHTIGRIATDKVKPEDRKDALTIAATQPIEAVNAAVSEAVAQGEITEARGVEITADVVKRKKALEAMPSNMSLDEKNDLADKIEQRQSLESELDKVDEATKPFVELQINQIDKSIPIPLPPKYMDTAGENTSELKDGQLYITRKGDVRMWDAAQKQFLEPPKSFEVEAKKETEQVKPTEEAAPQPEVATETVVETSTETTAEAEVTTIPQAGVVGGTNPALADVESTAKALEGVSPKLTNTPSLKEVKIVSLENANLSATEETNAIDAINENNQNNSWDKALRKNVENLGNGWFRVGKTMQGESIIYSPTANKSVVLKGAKSDAIAVQDFVKNNFGNPKTTAESYHKAKKDGSNPELVKAVEELLGQKESPSVQPNDGGALKVGAKRITKIEGAKDNLSNDTRSLISALNEYGENVVSWSEVEGSRISGITDSGKGKVEKLGKGVEVEFYNPSSKTTNKFFVAGDADKIIPFVEKFVRERQESQAKPLQTEAESQVATLPTAEIDQVDAEVKPTIFDQYDNTKGASKKDKVIEQYAKESGKDKADRVRDIIDNFDAIKSRLQELISEGKIDNIEIRC